MSRTTDTTVAGLMSGLAGFATVIGTHKALAPTQEKPPLSSIALGAFAAAITFLYVQDALRHR